MGLRDDFGQWSQSANMSQGNFRGCVERLDRANYEDTS
jgi:hypothetical protein